MAETVTLPVPLRGYIAADGRIEVVDGPGDPVRFDDLSSAQAFASRWNRMLVIRR